MELKQVFWQQKIRPNQLIVDWDTFIGLFEEFILEQISIRINEKQKQYIKTLVDPENRQEVYKNSYMLFVKQFWDIPSNRTKLLKGQLNLNHSKVPRLRFLADLANEPSVIVEVWFQDDEGDSAVSWSGKKVSHRIYQWRQEKVYLIDKGSEALSDKAVKCESFLTVGSSVSSDVRLNCKHLNSEHFKLIRMTKPKPESKLPSYMVSGDDRDEKKPPKTTSEWFVRDVSKSNRLEYSLATEAHVILRRGMVVSVGMVADMFEIYVEEATSDSYPQNGLSEIRQLINEHRVDFMGEVDASVPETLLVDISNQEVTEKEVQIWYSQGLRYQQSNSQGGNSSTQNQRTTSEARGKGGSKEGEENFPLRVTVLNLITQKKNSYIFSQNKVTVGREKSCEIHIDHMSVRSLQCEFVCMMGCWMVRGIGSQSEATTTTGEQTDSNSWAAKSSIKGLSIKEPSVRLATAQMRESRAVSNRLLLSVDAVQQFVGKGFKVEVRFPKIEQNGESSR